MVGVTGLEPVTSSLSVKCSNQLSYTPKSQMQAATKTQFKLTFHGKNCK